MEMRSWLLMQLNDASIYPFLPVGWIG